MSKIQKYPPLILNTHSSTVKSSTTKPVPGGRAASRSEILKFFEETLRSESFEDRSLNGLQIEGAEQIELIATAVDAAQASIDGAIDAGAQLLLVHHGFFWGTPLAVVGPFRQVVSTALKGQLNVVAYHLPLDANHEYGNNFQLARVLGLSDLIPAIDYRGGKIGCIGSNGTLPFADFLAKFSTEIPTDARALALPFGPTVPQRVAVVSGAAADSLEAYVEEGFDTLITGEVRQSAYHYARDHKLNILFLGHYASEVIGVRSLGEAVSKKFGIRHQFLHYPTGI